MNYINEVESNDINMKPFKVKKRLHKDFFKDNEILNPQIRMRLLDIADDFVKTLEVKWVKPLDIVVTGSIVNYNWSEYSDVDVHVIYDFNKIYDKPEFVQDYFMSKRDTWNKSHENLTMKGFPVELSVEDVNTPLQSSGVYSLEKNKWVKKPKQMDDSSIDIEGIQKYCAKQMTKMDELFAKMDKENDRKKLETLANKLESILDAVHDKRKEGLKTKEKELSNGNIMWKVVKHMGYVEKVYDYLNKVYDRRNTINEDKVIYLSENQAHLLENIYKNRKKYNHIGAYLPKMGKILGIDLFNKDLSKIHSVFDKYYKSIVPKNELTDNIYLDNVVNSILNNPKFRKELKKEFGVDRNNNNNNNSNYTVNPGNSYLYYRPNDVDYKKDDEDLYYNPAEHMETFINTDDVSTINETK